MKNLVNNLIAQSYMKKLQLNTYVKDWIHENRYFIRKQINNLVFENESVSSYSVSENHYLKEGVLNIDFNIKCYSELERIVIK